MIKITFPRANQNSDSPYHWTAKTLMMLDGVFSEIQENFGQAVVTHAYMTITTAMMAPTGIAEVQY
jgi:hypothetical protein